MKRSTAMLAGAATMALAAGAVASSPAMADPIPVATSYADLLNPVPNAMERLAADDANQPAARMELAQYGGPVDHHHHQQQYNQYDQNGGQGYNNHHHHQQIYNRYDQNRGHRYHHHHHNRRWYQSNGYNWDGYRWVLRPVHHHHHHHHNNGYL
jgi:hypothetical protein